MKLVLIALFLCLGGIFFVRYLEHQSLYFPMRDIVATPAMIHRSFEDIYFETKKGVRLHGWYVATDLVAIRKPFIILLCHGNGGNISHRIDKIVMLNSLGADVFIFDYRGYGKSEGKPSEQGFYEDARAAYDYLQSRAGFDHSLVVAYGESLGGAVAVVLAESRSLRALIVEDTFTSVHAMARSVYPYIPSFLIKAQYNSLNRISSIDIPKLMIHSVDDEIVPYRLGKELYEKATEPKRFIKLRGSHNTAFLDDREVWLDGIGTFLKSLEDTQIAEQKMN